MFYNESLSIIAQGATTSTAASTKDLLSALAPGLTAITGVVFGLVVAWKNQSDVYRDRLSQYQSAFDRHIDSLKSAHEAEKRSLQILLRQKESDVKNLRQRIKNLEGFYSLSFSTVEKKNDVLEKLILFLKYTENKVQDENFKKEVESVENYLKSQLGLVDRQRFRFEASEWLESHNDSLVEACLVHFFSDSEGDKDEFRISTNSYLKALCIALNAGLSQGFNKKFIDYVKTTCRKDYLYVLEYIRDYKIGGYLHRYAHEEIEKYIDNFIGLLNDVF